MLLREASGAPQSHSTTSIVPGAVPGGRSRSNTDATEIRSVLHHRHPLQFLIELISKSSNHVKSTQWND
jgi:hypothetical protein